MHTDRRGGDADGLSAIDPSETRVLGAKEERRLLQELADARGLLDEALAKVPEAERSRGADDPQALAPSLATSSRSDGPAEVRLGAVYRRYAEVRGRLALANLRLVAHVAKRFRDRGVPYGDLMQEGFCGLLEAIDRFDLSHRTKLATYATWWIRQAMQRAVAAGAYPVRLSPRHLRQLAHNQDELDRVATAGPDAVAQARVDERAGSELIRRIHTATRPTVSLDATLDR